MATRVESSRGTLGEVVGRIVSRVNPWRIVLFGSRARGNPTPPSDYDLYVEVDDTEAPLKAIRNRIWDVVHGLGLTVDVKVHPRGTIERRRDAPGTIEWDVAREGRNLYADAAAPRKRRSPPHRRFRAIAPDCSACSTS